MRMPRPILLSLALLAAPILAYAAGSVTLAPNETVDVVSTDCDLSSAQSKPNLVTVACAAQYTPTVTATATLTNTPSPTAMAAATATATPAPTMTSTPAPTPAPAALHEGVPICGNHDPSKWHDLVERDAAGAIACTHLHHHGSNPHALDAELGPVGAWAGITDEISYPWQTGGGTENVVKHNFYKWMVFRAPANQRCVTPNNQPFSYSAIRLQAHDDGAHGASVRFHSFSLEAVICQVSTGQDVGHIRTGGHLDYGQLFLQKSDASIVHVPLPSDAATFDHSGLSGNRKLHAYLNDSFKRNITWYASNPSAATPGRLAIVKQIGINADDVGYVDPADPTDAPVPFTDTHPQLGPYNHSREEEPHLLDTSLFNYEDDLDGVRDGWLVKQGFTDRNGALVTAACTPPALDCIPLDVRMPAGSGRTIQHRADSRTRVTPPVEHDVKSPVNGKSLIRMPN